QNDGCDGRRQEGSTFGRRCNREGAGAAAAIQERDDAHAWTEGRGPRAPAGTAGRPLDVPHLTLIRFEASGGSYWDSPGGMLHVAASFAKSLATGVPGKGGEAGDLHL